jgi:hypothetical protein
MGLTAADHYKNTTTMKVPSTLVAGLAGTTAMTIFSYLLSKKRRSNFMEPELLAKMAAAPLGKPLALVGGWAVHYGVGVLFSGIYSGILRPKHFRRPVRSGSLVGALTGVVAVLGWHTCLSLHPSPPVTQRKRFYGQLITGHMIFAVVSLSCQGENGPAART